MDNTREKAKAHQEKENKRAKEKEKGSKGTVLIVVPMDTQQRIVPKAKARIKAGHPDLGKVLAKILLTGSVHPEELRIWNMWVDRDRASPSAVRVLLHQR